jgi:UDP-N-acetylmuramate dehydrogenase
MNAGAHGREISDVVETCEVYDIEKKERRTLAANELNFGYRDSIFQHEKLIALSAKFNLKEGNKAEISAKVSKYLGERKTKQPLDFPSAGSFFKRPPGAFAGRLIEEAGLKGAAVGGAKVSEKHAGFIINAGATSADIVQLKDLIVERVYADSGITLEPEVKIISP